MTPDEYEQRDRKIVERHLAGETLTDLGEAYGISRERVRQIVRKKGVTPEESRAAYARSCMVTATCKGCGKVFERHYSQLKQQEGYCRPNCSCKHTREILLQHLVELADNLGRTPTQRDLIAHSPPSHMEYYNKFDGLREAQRLAGLTPNERGWPNRPEDTP